jgi:hypothetical protein
VNEQNQSSFMKSAGWCGLIASLAFLTTVMVPTLGAPTKPDNQGEIAEYLAKISDGVLPSYIYGYGGILFCVLYIPLCIATFWLLGRTSLSLLGSLAIAIGLGILVPAYVAAMLPATGLVPATDQLGLGGNDSLYAIFAVVDAAAGIFFTVGSILTLAIGPFLWGLTGLRSGGISRWLAWVGITTGITGLIWFVWLLQGPIVLFVLLINVVLSLVFYTAVAIALLKSAKTQPADITTSR